MFILPKQLSRGVMNCCIIELVAFLKGLDSEMELFY